MLFRNNLVINLNSTKYTPLLINLVSFRRRILNSQELGLIKSMVAKHERADLYSGSEKDLYDALRREKQVLDQAVIKQVDDIIHTRYKENRSKVYDKTDIKVIIQLTEECNMSCVYCYENSYLGRKDELRHMTEGQVDGIQRFYEEAGNELGAELNIKEIVLTGGEPLYDEKCVNLINYIALKWPEARISMQTNGVNLIKFYDQLPLSVIDRLSVSLDGIEATHLKRRYRNSNHTNKSIYAGVIDGIKRLIADKKDVTIASTFDCNNYKEYPEFVSYLNNERILGKDRAKLIAGAVLDNTNECRIDESFNNKSDMLAMREFFAANLEGTYPGLAMFPGMGKLAGMLSRKENSFVEPKDGVCKGRYFSNQFFSPNGLVYICLRVSENSGVIGSYYPDIKIDYEKIDRIINYEPIIHNEKCRDCAYKYVCLSGGCPMILENQNKSFLCGPYADDEIMDNLVFNMDAVSKSI